MDDSQERKLRERMEWKKALETLAFFKYAEKKDFVDDETHLKETKWVLMMNASKTLPEYVYSGYEENKEIQWDARQHSTRISVGDKIIILRNKSNGQYNNCKIIAFGDLAFNSPRDISCLQISE